MLFDRDTALLENEVAVALRDAFGEDLHYLKSSKHGIDIDFYAPEHKLAVQVAYSISGEARAHEVGNLVKLHWLQDYIRLVIVTMAEQETISEGDATIEVVPAWRLLLDLT